MTHRQRGRTQSIGLEPKIGTLTRQHGTTIQADPRPLSLLTDFLLSGNMQGGQHCFMPLTCTYGTLLSTKTRRLLSFSKGPGHDLVPSPGGSDVAWRTKWIKSERNSLVGYRRRKSPSGSCDSPLSIRDSKGRIAADNETVYYRYGYEGKRRGRIAGFKEEIRARREERQRRFSLLS